MRKVASNASISRLPGQFLAVIGSPSFPYFEFLPNTVFSLPPVNGNSQPDGPLTLRGRNHMGGATLTQNASERRQIHWAKTRKLTYVVLVIWFIFAFVLPWFAKDLNAVSFIGFKLGYYLVVQGSLIVFVVLIIGQNIIQDSIDDEYGSGDT